MTRFAPRPLLAVLLAGFAAGAPAALDVASFDPGIDACIDFYGHVNHRWIESTPIPDDRTSWGTGSQLDQRNEKLLLAALESLRAAPPAPGTPQRKAVDFFASGMDTAAIEKAGFAPIQPLAKRIDAIQGGEDVARAIAVLHSRGIGAGFDFGVEPDAKDSSTYLAQMEQGGLGLPDRDFYFNDDERSKAQREAYRKHVARTFELAGAAPAAAAKASDAVYALETELAKASRKRVDLRVPEKNYHKKTRAELEALAPGFAWKAYFGALGGDHIRTMNVAQPEFFEALGRLSREQPVEAWRAYLRWHLLRASADKLGRAIDQEHFDFYERTLKGRKAEPPRHRRVLTVISGNYGEQPMGQAVGMIFVDTAFSPEAKARALELVDNVKAALADRIRTLDWMGDDTKQRALAKLSAMRNKIGYPDKWRDYSDAKVGRKAFAENWLEANAFRHRLDLSRVGKPVDADDWWMSPQIFNAYYGSARNEIVFPAAILQPPMFDAKADDALNYGAIGMVIGHEITHGFDDRGRKFDAKGNMTDWWTAEDAKRYEERAQRMVKQYSGFEGVEGIKVNGQLTLGENISDLGGLKIAYLALQKALKDHPTGKIDGYTPEQRFFLSYAQAWRNRQRLEQERLYLQTDTHSPPRYRVGGPIANMPEFAQAFSCDPARTLLSESERANIW